MRPPGALVALDEIPNKIAGPRPWFRVRRGAPESQIANTMKTTSGILIATIALSFPRCASVSPTRINE